MSGTNSITAAERSAIFSRYNRLRHQMEPGRANRALGLAQTGEDRPYNTTEDWCSCPDFQHRGGTCKHIAALNLKEAAQKTEPEPELEPQEAEPEEDINDVLGLGMW